MLIAESRMPNDVVTMFTEEEALAKIVNSVAPLEIEQVVLAEGLDRFASSEVPATVALPAFDNSAMDGYAVVASSAVAGARLKIVGEQPAGISRNLRIGVKEAVRIFTGAPLPEGADAVVMQEETQREGDHVVIASECVAAGDFVRKAGGDLAKGQHILRRGEKLTPPILALLASQGLEQVKVHRRAKVVIVTTGDEMARPGATPQPGEIFETNGTLLAALTQRVGAEVVEQSHCNDDLDELDDAFAAARAADALIISGGVSVGERDFVRQALSHAGFELDLWRVSIKPGKPFLFGMRERCCVFGLPGNPVSSFVTFLVFVRPALLRMMGAAETRLPESAARLTHDIAGDKSRPHYLRGKLANGLFTPVGRQESHALFGLARANALLRVPVAQNLPAQSEVVVVLLD